MQLNFDMQTELDSHEKNNPWFSGISFFNTREANIKYS